MCHVLAMVVVSIEISISARHKCVIIGWVKIRGQREGTFSLIAIDVLLEFVRLSIDRFRVVGAMMI